MPSLADEDTGIGLPFIILAGVLFLLDLAQLLQQSADRLACASLQTLDGVFDSTVRQDGDLDLFLVQCSLSSWFSLVQSRVHRTTEIRHI